MTMNSADLAALRAKAEASLAAIPDLDWYRGDSHHICKSDKPFIAAASPSVILALIARLEAAEKALEQTETALEDCLEYFEDRQDADYDSEMGFIPNKEMEMASIIKRAQEALPSADEKRAQADRCSCKGSDDYCQCQNVADRETVRARAALTKESKP